MFKNLFKRIDGVFSGHEQKLTAEEKFFFNVVGYSDIKKLLLKSVVSKEPVNILLTGPPSSSKTVFLLEMLEGLDDTYFIDAVGASGPGMTDHLFNNNTKYLLIDEIDKMKKNDQATLLNVMETGILSETKLKGKTRQKKMKLWIFATSNDVERLSEPLRSRFMELHLEEYTYEEFTDIAIRRLAEEKINKHLAIIIAEKVWTELSSRDIRDVIKVGRLTNDSREVSFIIGMMKKG
jgi:replication-associated recombination protein RarA